MSVEQEACLPCTNTTHCITENFSITKLQEHMLLLTQIVFKVGLLTAMQVDLLEPTFKAI